MQLQHVPRKGVSVMEILAAIAIWSMACVGDSAMESFSLSRKRSRIRPTTSIVGSRNVLAASDGLKWSDLTQSNLDSIAVVASKSLPENDEWFVESALQTPAANAVQPADWQSRLIKVTVRATLFHK